MGSKDHILHLIEQLVSQTRIHAEVNFLKDNNIKIVLKAQINIYMCIYISMYPEDTGSSCKPIQKIQVKQQM